MPEKWLIQVSAALNTAARAAAKKAGLKLSEWVRRTLAGELKNAKLADVPPVGNPNLKKKVSKKKAAKKKPG